MARKPTFIPRMCGVAGAPGPATELGAAVVVNRLLDFCCGVHHKRTVLRHGLCNRAALQNQQFSGSDAIH